MRRKSAKRAKSLPDWGLSRASRLLEMLNHDFEKGWMNDWEASRLEAELDEDNGSELAVSEEDLRMAKLPLLDPEGRFSDLDESQARRCQTLVREYTDAWLGAKFDLSKWSLRERFLKAVNRRTAYFKRRTGGGAELVFDLPRQDSDRGESWAVYLFLQYITGDYFNRIGRCVRCGEYYMAESRRKRKYCSDRCNRYTSSVKFTRKARSEDREWRLDLVRKAIRKFNALKTSLQRQKDRKRWQAWVVSAVNEKLRSDPRDRVTSNFITRAINNHEIDPPVWKR